MMSPLYLVDASIYVFRSYYSIPPNFFSEKGELINAVYGYTQFLLDLALKEPQMISVAFDESLVSCYRNDIYPEYKANRELPDENLKYQLARCQEITHLLGFHHLSLKDYEADDIIGTLLARFGAGREAIIVTRDKDLGQLLRPGDRLWDFAADKYMGADDIFAKFGVRPDQIADYLALAGDTVDNIPGIPGIGAKTAAALLAHFESLEGLLANLDAVSAVNVRGAKKLGALIAEHVEAVRTFRQLTEIKCDVPMEVVAGDLQLTPAGRDALDKFCDEMSFGGRIRDRIGRVLEA